VCLARFVSALENCPNSLAVEGRILPIRAGCLE
jgi:hypothetical protein